MFRGRLENTACSQDIVYLEEVMCSEDVACSEDV